MYDLVLRNAVLAPENPAERFDLAISDGRWAALGAVAESGREELDLAGALLFPGAVDLHVHFNEPGRTAWEGFASGSQAALAGGITAVAEMPLNSIPSTTSVAHLAAKRAAIGSQSWVDFGLWGGLQPDNLDELAALAHAGVMGFKAFLSPSGTDEFQNVGYDLLAEGMKRIAETGLPLAIHAEDPATLEQASARLGQRESAWDWEASRPVEAELVAVSRVIESTRATGCRTHIVHVSHPRVAELISHAAMGGVPVSGETCPHYLLLDLVAAERLGARAKCAPPLRRREDVEGLWEALELGWLQTIGSDHSPCPPVMKQGSFFEAWGGINGIQYGWRLLLERALRRSSPPLAELLAMGTQAPADLVGWPRKMGIREGADADAWWLQTLGRDTRLSVADGYARYPLSPYDGSDTRWLAPSVLLRGRFVCDRGSLLGEPLGEFLPGAATATA